MKPILIVSIVSLGLVGGAYARASDDIAPPSAYASAAPMVSPDWKLPTPCNVGALELLASSAGRLIAPANAENSDGVELADYKCAGNAPPRRSTVTPPPAPSHGK